MVHTSPLCSTPNTCNHFTSESLTSALLSIPLPFPLTEVYHRPILCLHRTLRTTALLEKRMESTDVCNDVHLRFSYNNLLTPWCCSFLSTYWFRQIGCDALSSYFNLNTSRYILFSLLCASTNWLWRLSWLAIRERCKIKKVKKTNKC